MNSKRVASIDALRGFDMFFIMGLATLFIEIFSEVPGRFASAIVETMDHVGWNGIHHHDTIFPLFLFLAGVSFPFSWAKQQANNWSKKRTYTKIISRGFILAALGIVYNGLLTFRPEDFRICSVLGRIGMAWMFGALIWMNTKSKGRIIITVSTLIIYGLVSKYIGAPDIADADPLSRKGCLAAYVDRMILGGFDPEGILSTIPAIVTALLGMMTGELIRTPEEKVSGNKKALYMAVAGILFGLIAWGFNGVLPINKCLWSSTFVCATASYSLLMMSLFYYLIDVKGYQKWAFIFKVVGMNSITIYLAQAIIPFGSISDFFLEGITSYMPEYASTIVNSCGYIIVCWLFLYFLYKKKIFFKI